MYTAVEEGHLSIVKLLIENGADVNQSPTGLVARDVHIEHQTPLLIACIKNHEEIVRCLIEAGANVNASSQRGSSPFLAICQHNNADLARLLIQHGARYDIEVTNVYMAKINGLIVAAESGSFDILKLLVEAGLDVNYKIDGPVSYCCCCFFFSKIQKIFHHHSKFCFSGRNGRSNASVLRKCQRFSGYCRVFDRKRCRCQCNRKSSIKSCRCSVFHDKNRFVSLDRPFVFTHRCSHGSRRYCSTSL